MFLPSPFFFFFWLNMPNLRLQAMNTWDLLKVVQFCLSTEGSVIVALFWCKEARKNLLHGTIHDFHNNKHPERTQFFLSVFPLSNKCKITPQTLKPLFWKCESLLLWELRRFLWHWKCGETHSKHVQRTSDWNNL